jgi:capsular polysaccharide biosynthesis protein
MTGVWNPVGFDWLREKFADYQSPRADGTPIFLTRRGITRIPNNLSEIEGHFSSNGYRIIDCGMHSVKEQIRLASSAPAIAGLHGAAMTNVLWARPRTPVLELFTCGHLNACYEQISFQGELNYKGCILDGQNDLYNIARWCKVTNRHLLDRFR